MRKLLLLITLLISALCARAELWTPVGQALWQEGMLSSQHSSWDGLCWIVPVEQSDERPDVFRMQPYSNHSNSANNQFGSKWEYSDVYMYIHIEDCNKIWVEPFRYYYYDYLVGYKYYEIAQRCDENSYNSEYYGKTYGNTIEFPVGAFQVYNSGDLTKYSAKDHRIIFPPNILKSLPEVFVPIGEGTWTDPFFEKGGEIPEPWQVQFEKSIERPGYYRVRPYKSKDAVEFNGWSDPVAIILNAENPAKVYFEPFELDKCGFISQKVETGMYGELEDGKIIIPGQALKIKTEYEPRSVRDLMIVLPDGYTDTPSVAGVFFGITAFNYEPQIRPIELISLENKASFKEFVNSQSKDDATYLYYSTDQAINALSNHKYPENLGSVALITFTDGNDDGSLEMVDPTWNDHTYQRYLAKRIKETKVQNIPINAFSIGLKGKDNTDLEMFKSNLQVLASSDDQAMEVNNMSEVEATINEILDNLERSWVNKKIMCSINVRATGDIIRFTLDKSSEELNGDPDKSELWIEGTFSRTDNSLNDIVYHGLTSTSGNKVVSEKIEIEEDGRVKVKYRFTFENLRDLEGNVFEPGKIAFFHRTSSTGKWQPHTEFRDGEDSGTETSRTSSAIMFVMDCSDSLGDDFPELQRVVNSLIDRLVPEGSSGIDTPRNNS